MAVQKVVRKPDYSDLDLDFIPHPTTGDVVKKTGLEAIKRSVRNLILTNFYDRPFRTYIGSNAQKILFDNINPLTATFLKNAIIETLVNFEPRIQLLDDDDRGVFVQVDPDNNGYLVKISFIIINRGEPASINIFLERIR
jgi:phage baseplate assembly protein W